MDVVNAILKPVVDILMVPVKEHLGYMFFCSKYIKDMHHKMEELDAARNGIEDHKKRNKTKNLEIPYEVDGWLKEVGDINTEVGNVRSDVGSCFNIKLKHKVGKEAFKIIEDIESLIRKYSLIKWTDDPIPLGMVGSSTSTKSSHHQDFETRERTFREALKMLDPNHKSHMIALCGMPGVRKTTMMQDLKNVVKEKRMFSFIVEAVIGEKTDPIAIQKAVADYFSITLNEETKLARADRLRKCFEGQSEGGRNKILVILDDVWEYLDLNDIGLSPLPNQGVDFKILLTSRNRNICNRMGVNSTSIIDVKVLTNLEAQELFYQLVNDSNDADLDHDFHEIGDNIVRRCQGLPIAIKTIACNLKGQSKEAWDNALDHLNHNDIEEIVHQVFEVSYNNLKSATQSTFLLCGLYPEDFSIPTEDLLRYGWGLNLFKNMYTIKQARNRLHASVQELINANLLIETHCVGWVKMHDLVRAFLLSMISQGEHVSIVKHDNMEEWPLKEMFQSCKRLSLTCNNMFDFPREFFKYKNLELLKSTNGDNLLRHSQDFYGKMEDLKVIAYERTHYLAFSKSLHCSITLRTLCLEYCSLTFDYSIIGNLLNLEVLSFSYSRIRKLPSIIGNLKKLKLLDMTGCENLCIDSGVLKKLVHLEELYARVGTSIHFWEFQKAIRFSYGNTDDLTKCSNNLSILEIELFESNSQPMNMSFEKLERYNISLGCFSTNMGENLLPFENKLMLATSKGELLGSRMNKLFLKTKVLYLQVSDMNDLEEVDVDVKSLCPPQQSSFSNLRLLCVSECTELRYLFTSRVASTLSKLEDLRISSCPNLETLIHLKGSGLETIAFLNLKHLVLRDLPKLLSLCNTTNVIELPQVMELELYNLPKVINIYAQNKSTRYSTSSNISTVQSLLTEEVKISMLRKIIVESCDSLVNIFPVNPISLIVNLEDLQVRYCDSIEVLFNIDLGCLNEIKGNSSLRNIEVWKLPKLKELWRVKVVNNSNLAIHSFQALESLKIAYCGSFRNLFTPTTASFDLGGLSSISMVNVGENNEFDDINQMQEMIDKSKEEIFEVTDKISNVAISSQVIFEVEIVGATNGTELGYKQQASLLPYLKQLELKEVEHMHHVWKCNNWN